MHIKEPRDFWSGLIFVGAGLFIAIYGGTHYAYGAALRMGPGYFPVWLGALTAIVGAVLLVRSLVLTGPPLPKFHWRSVTFIVLACLLFGYLLRPAGLVLSTAVLVIVGAFGGHEFRWKEAITAAIALVIFAWMVFVWGLSMPLPLWPEFLQ